MPQDESEPVEFPITDELDLHTFRPGEVKELLVDYIEAAREKGLTRVRIIHGKGTGSLRELVRAQLEKNPQVIRWETAGVGEGTWGATIAILAPVGHC